jgi:hypothetical protein
MSSQSIGCSKGEPLRRGGSSAGKLQNVLAGILVELRRIPYSMASSSTPRK